MTTTPDPNQRVVLHGEFEAFRTSTDRSLNDLKEGQDRTNETLARAFADIRTELRNATRKDPTNWGWMIGGVTLLMAFIALYVTPVRTTVEELGQRLWNIETSRYTVQDGKSLRDRMESRDDLIIAKIDESNQRAWDELVKRSEWMGGAERDISENAHELDLIWSWRHDKADKMLDTHAMLLRELERRVGRNEADIKKQRGAP